MADRIGQQLGNYRLTRLLGQGGFADVYLGEHVYLRTLAAVKVLQTRLSNDSDLERFLNEARTVGHLSHPNIVRVLDFGVASETPFLVMDYAPSGTLRQRHPKGTQLPITAIIPYVKSIADALQYAHDRKLIHRDIKPENMLLGRGHEVLLSDFGIALITQSSRDQSTQDIVGTIGYMSPEQIQGKPRAASDQYSLATVVYEWLSGDRPFQGSFIELCTQHMFTPPPPLKEKVPTIDPAIEQVVTIALAKDPKERFRSISAFANALSQAANGQSAPPIVYAPLLPNRLQLSPILLPPPEQVSPLASTEVMVPTDMEPTQLDSSPGPRFPSPQKRRLGRRFSFLVGGALGLILLLAVLIITIGLIMSVQGGRSVLPTTRSEHIGQKWAFLTGDKAQSTPTVVNGVLYIGSDDGNVYAINASTSQQKWAFPTGGAVSSRPTVVNGVLYIGSYDNKVYAIDALTGQQKWAFPTGDKVPSSPTVVNGVLYIGSDDGNVYAIDALTSQQRWVFPTGGAVSSSPTVVNGVLYIGSWDDKVYAVDASTSQQKWTFSTGGAVHSSPMVANGVLYIGSDDGKVYAIDALTGQQKWAFSTGNKVFSSPTVVNGILYIGSYDNKVYAIDALTGQRQWAFPTGNGVYSSPTVVNGVLYIGSGDGNVYAIDASTGQRKWVFPTSGAVISSPMVVNGVLYVGSWDDKVYAIDVSAVQQ